MGLKTVAGYGKIWVSSCNSDAISMKHCSIAENVTIVWNAIYNLLCFLIKVWRTLSLYNLFSWNMPDLNLWRSCTNKWKYRSLNTPRGFSVLKYIKSICHAA